jgi:E3 ubiquitin-protein ligase RNF144
VGVEALTDQEMKRYEAKVEEAFTQKYKFYCHDTNCNEYIPTSSLNQRSGTCLYCGRKTCKLCFAKTHWGPCNKEIMAKDSGVADELMNKMAVSKKWKKCPNCQKIVEKIGGCNQVM